MVFFSTTIDRFEYARVEERVEAALVLIEPGIKPIISALARAFEVDPRRLQRQFNGGEDLTGLEGSNKHIFDV